MRDRKFGYNAFSITGLFGPCLLPLFLIMFPGTLLVVTVYVMIVLAIGYAITQRPFLTIGPNGITLNYLFKGRQQVGWKDVGAFRYGVTKGTGKTEQKGWGIARMKDEKRVGRMSTAFERGQYVLFIPESYVAAPRKEVEEALEDGIKRYVRKEKTRQPIVMDGDRQNSMVMCVVLLCLVWAGINAYALHLNALWMPEAWEPIMKLTLVGGERFDGGNSFLYGLWWAIVYGALLLVPNLFIKKNYKMSAIALGVGIVYVLFVGLFEIKERHEVFVNCTEPSYNPVVEVHANITSNVLYKKDRNKSKMTFLLAFEGKNYTVDMDYVEVAHAGMPITVQLKKGARGLPIITKLEIPRAGWLSNTLGNAYNTVSYYYADRGEYLKAIETIDKAIKLYPDEANYYDTKGEHLYRKGEKDRAREMRIRCLNLDPYFDVNHHSDLKKLLGEADVQREVRPVKPVSPQVVETLPVQGNDVLSVVEQMPEFPGGQTELLRWISEHIHYPIYAEKNGIQGRVICTFVVERDGSVTDIQVARSIDPSLDAEAVRVLSQMPSWNPGKQNGSPVRVKYTVPITFKLQ